MRNASVVIHDETQQSRSRVQMNPEGITPGSRHNRVEMAPEGAVVSKNDPMKTRVQFGVAPGQTPAPPPVQGSGAGDLNTRVEIHGQDPAPRVLGAPTPQPMTPAVLGTPAPTQAAGRVEHRGQTIHAGHDPLESLHRLREMTMTEIARAEKRLSGINRQIAAVEETKAKHRKAQQEADREQARADELAAQAAEASAQARARRQRLEEEEAASLRAAQAEIEAAESDAQEGARALEEIETATVGLTKAPLPPGSSEADEHVSGEARRFVGEGGPPAPPFDPPVTETFTGGTLPQETSGDVEPEEA